MTMEDILRLAHEAGFDDFAIGVRQELLERFAALVASAEREACAKVAEKAKTPFTATAIRARGQA